MDRVGFLSWICSSAVVWWSDSAAMGELAVESNFLVNIELRVDLVSLLNLRLERQCVDVKK